MPLLDRYQARAYTPSATVGALAVQNGEHLLVGTSEGLFRFDGRQVLEHLHEGNTPAFVYDTTHLVVPLHSGEIFVALSVGLAPGLRDRHGLLIERHGRPALCFLSHGGAQPIKFPDGAPEAAEMFRGAVQTPSGALWIATEAGLATIEDRKFRLLTDRNPALRVPIHAIAADEQGDLWLGTDAGVLRLHAQGELTRVGNIDEAVTTLAISGAEIWAGVAGGLLQIGSGEVHRHAFPATFRDHATLIPHAMAIEANGDVWVAADDVLMAFDKKRFTAIGRQAGLHDTVILSLAPDPYHGMWAGTRSAGLALIERPLARMLDSAEGLPPGSARAIVELSDQSVWMTTSTGLYRMEDVAGFQAVAWPADLGSPGSLEGGADNTLWVATERGLVRRTTARTEMFFERVGTMPTSLRVDESQQTLWTTWADGAVVAMNTSNTAPGQAKATFDKASGLCGGRLNAIELARDGTMIVGGNNGLATIKNGRAQCRGKMDGRLGREITSIARDESGAIWIGTRFNSGVLRYEGDDLVAFTESHGLPCDTVYHVRADQNGHLWFACRAGLARVRIEDLHANANDREREIPAMFFNRRDGISEIPAYGYSPGIWADRAGRAMSTNVLGLVVANVSHHRQTSLPRVKLEAPVFDGQPLTSGAVVRSVLGDFAVKLNASLLSRSHQLVFRHRLRNKDAVWTRTQAVGESLIVRHSGLVPGTYTFEVACGDGLGAWSPVTQLAFSVKRPLHRNPAFLLFVGLALLSAAYVGHRVRLIRTRARFALVAEERARMARDLHDNLGQGLTGLAFHLDAIERHHAREDGNLRKLAHDARGILTVLRQQITKSIWDLRHEGPDAPSFRLAALDLINRLRRLPGAPMIAFEADRNVKLSTLQAHEFLGIIGEGVTNAIRHAGAKTVTVWIRSEPDRIILTVQDDGQGLTQPVSGKDTAPVVGHFGILGMKERARRLGASFSIQTRPAGGTRIEVVLDQQPIVAKVKT